MYVCMFVCMCVCMYLCMYVYIMYCMNELKVFIVCLHKCSTVNINDFVLIKNVQFADTITIDSMVWYYTNSSIYQYSGIQYIPCAPRNTEYFFCIIPYSR